jgi:regulator of sirC expression with transglutaminase-like and TPR domain
MDPSLQAFADLIRAPEPDIDLGRASLAIARVEYPDLAAEEYVARLDRLAAESGVADVAPGRPALDRLREFLFDEQGFRGNADEYYDPRNSCLNDVLDRRLGIPITLSVVMLEVGRRVGVPIVGIGLPGHFVVGARLASGRVVLDPFNGGAVLTDRGATDVVSRALGRRVRLAESDFAPSSKTHMIVRMLRNLKSVYWKQEAWDKALAVVDRLRLLEAESTEHLRDRGTVLVKLGCFHHGAAEWEAYLERCPNAQDAEGVRHELRRIRQALAVLN